MSDFDAGRQNATVVDAIDLCFDPLNCGCALLSAAHEHDALHDVVVVVRAGNAETRCISDNNRRHIANQHWIAASLGKHRTAQILERADQADTAHDG
jgi:hypothetical protein